MPKLFKRYAAKRGARKPKRRVARMKRYKTPTKLTSQFNFKRVVAGTAINGIAARAYAQTNMIQHLCPEFLFSEIPAYSEFSNLFDQYRINKIRFQMIPMMTVNNVQAVAGSGAGASMGNPGIIGSVLDYDDANLLGNLTDYEQYPSWKFCRAVGTCGVDRTFVPGCLLPIVTAGGSLQAGPVKKKQWIDMGQPNASHFGIKIYMDASASSLAPQYWQIHATIWFSCRHPR
jgi:hypothetical protein